MPVYLKTCLFQALPTYLNIIQWKTARRYIVAPIARNLLPMLLPALAFSLLVIFSCSGVVWLFVDSAVVVFSLGVVVFINAGSILVVIRGLVLLVIFLSVAGSIVVIAISVVVVLVILVIMVYWVMLVVILVVATVVGFTLLLCRKQNSDVLV